MSLTLETSPPPNKGKFASEAAALEAVVERLVRALDPAAIWLFGSRARGTARPDSDFDLLVVAKPNGALDGGSYFDVYEPVCGMGLGIDVVPCGYVDFEDAKALKTTLVARIVEEGRLLYEAPPN
jgi:predicted nucleotidyltransferase